jgi:hypothetical protein
VDEQPDPVMVAPPTDTQIAPATPAPLNDPSTSVPDATAPRSHPLESFSCEIALCFPMTGCLPLA